jgi:hypothetical protein
MGMAPMIELIPKNANATIAITRAILMDALRLICLGDAWNSSIIPAGGLKLCKVRRLLPL